MINFPNEGFHKGDLGLLYDCELKNPSIPIVQTSNVEFRLLFAQLL